VNGFSLSAKHWGLVLVEGLSDVESGAGAWESLVLPAAKKELLLALAATKLCPPTAARRASVDAIPGKGAGSLFLLHGPPGGTCNVAPVPFAPGPALLMVRVSGWAPAVGKTMTAEALAGHFGRPLYCLTFGELGSTVPELEVCVPCLADREYTGRNGGLQYSRAELPFFSKYRCGGALAYSTSRAWESSLVYESW
jgi:hypothetical protein